MSNASPTMRTISPSEPSRLSETRVPAAGGGSTMVSLRGCGLATEVAAGGGAMAAGGAMVLANASSPSERGPEEDGMVRGMPAGGVGLTAMVAATASWGAVGGGAVTTGATAAGAAATAAMGAIGAGATTAGLGVDTGVGAPESRCPQCWQKAKPD